MQPEDQVHEAKQESWIDLQITKEMLDNMHKRKIDMVFIKDGIFHMLFKFILSFVDKIITKISSSESVRPDVKTEKEDVPL